MTIFAPLGRRRKTLAILASALSMAIVARPSPAQIASIAGRVALPLKFSFVDMAKVPILKGMPISVTVRRTSDASALAQLVVVMRDVTGAGDRAAPDAALEMSVDGGVVISKRVSGVRRLEDVASQSAVAVDEYTFPLQVADVRALVSARTVEGRVRGKRLVVDTKHLAKATEALTALFPSLESVAEAKAPARMTPVSPEGATVSRDTGGRGSLIELLEPARIEGADTIGSRFEGPAGTTRKAPSGACGTQRLCTPDPDLRVVEVALKGSQLPSDKPVHVAVTVENRARTPSAPSELQLCYSDNSRTCAEKVDLLEVPPLGSGERITFSRSQAVAGRQSVRFLAQLDPERVTVDRDRGNDARASDEANIVFPEMQVVRIVIPDTVSPRLGGIPMTVTVRNKSFVTASPVVDLEFGADYGWRCGWGNNSSATVTVPRLAPRQSATFRLIARPPACHFTPNATHHLTVKIDGRNTKWGAAHERGAARTYLTVDR